MNRPHPLCGHGFGVALTTPFTADDAVDTAALQRLTRHVTDGGADFVVALGSTGEAAMLDARERDLVVAAVRAHCGRAKLVVGTGASSTAQASAWTRRAKDLGADGALVTVPPYTKPTQAGIEAHFERVAAAAPELPLIVYNVPSRVGADLQPATLAKLWRLPTVCAVKEASGDLRQITRIANELPPDRLLLAGDDALLLPTIAVGGHGVVSVAGNVAPHAMRALVDACRSSQLALAQRRARALTPLFDALSLEPNPIPIKAALAELGFGAAAPRLPLLPATDATRRALQHALHNLQTTSSHA